MSLRSRIKINSIAIGIAVLFALLALGFAGIALYQHLGQYFLPDVAALLTASVFLFLALLSLLSAKLFSMQDKSKPVAAGDSLQNKLAMIEAELQHSIDPTVRDWVIRHPGRSLTLTVLAGALVGSNADSRKLVKQFIDRHLGSG